MDEQLLHRLQKSLPCSTTLEMSVVLPHGGAYQNSGADKQVYITDQLVTRDVVVANNNTSHTPRC